MSQQFTIGTLNDIPQMGATTVETPNGRYAIFRTRNDDVFALRDQCPHKQGPLSQGIVAGNIVICPLHNWRIDLTSGKVQAPDSGCVNTLPIEAQADGTLILTLAD
ncbi:nitrite reductase small subunit NirD [Candidatus Albibeggiatoa sp. nov. NOAA]|uniref:nitrite reductase small subunit NirD n=1 Tax=Candidatus Albibeggiatoa sp. nov. NOAA TaxID=3162724 RepID=UPI0032FE437E|nr:nitrite reductase small subunit NirD [Thiotrichaceae bacterium]